MDVGDIMFSVDDDAGGDHHLTSSTSSTTQPSTSPALPASLAYPELEYVDEGEGLVTEPTEVKKKSKKIPVSVCSFPCKTGEIMIMNTVSSSSTHAQTRS